MMKKQSLAERRNNQLTGSFKGKRSKESYFERIYLSVFENLKDEITNTEELTLLLQYAGHNPSKKTLEKYWDKRKDVYSFEEFCDILKEEERCSKRNLLNAFKKIDVNRDGFITHDELFNVLTKRGERMTKAEVKEMIADADCNQDGKLDYMEFCNMMDSSINQIQEIHSKQMKVINDKNQMAQNKKVSNFDEKSFTSSKQERSKKTSIVSKISKEPPYNANPKYGNISKEPPNLSKWQFLSFKGSFFKESDDTVESHQYKIKVLQPTVLWMTIKSIAPKYGKYSNAIMETDMSLYLVDNLGKLIQFSNTVIDGRQCLLADVHAGSFHVYTYSSGAKLDSNQQGNAKISLLKGDGEDAKLTKVCRDTLLEIFYRCDLDGNGYLSREEFDIFQMRTSGEECDNEAWEVVKETFEVTPQEELTPNGFLELNLMEARDPDGGEDELWVTIEAMGYSKKLQLTNACPFHLEIFSQRGKVDVSNQGVNNGGEALTDCLFESIKSISNKSQMKSTCILHLAEFSNRTAIAAENKSSSSIRVNVDCSRSENLLSNRGSLRNSEEIKRYSFKIIHELVQLKVDSPSKLKFQEALLNV